MKLKFLICCLLASALPVLGQEPPLFTEKEDGRQLAERVRTLMPVENTVIKGELDIALKKKHRKIPVICSVVVRESTWETIYEAAATQESGPERLIIKRSTNGPNEYLYARASSPSDPLPELARIPRDQVATIFFCKSDFSIGDLGLEFLHWPEQVRMAGKPALGRPCFVLESRKSSEPEIVRVRSFIDKETGQPLKAEGYNAKDDREPVKMFSLAGSSFKKVNGQYRLEKLEIENFETGSDTTLRFQID